MDFLNTNDFYSFPPFFTLQPVETTRQQQLLLWRQLILKYCTDRNTSTINIYDFELFQNTAINRKLSSEGIIAVVNDLIASGHGEWQDANKTAVRIMIRTAPELANMIHSYMVTNGMVDTMYTVYELHSGDSFRNAEFFNIDPESCLKALEVLQQNNKVQLFPAEVIDETGVKFSQL